MDTDSLTVHVTTDDFYKNIAEDLETRFDTSNFELYIPLPKGKNRKEIELLKNELGGRIIKEFFELWIKTYNYLKDNNEDRKAKSTKKCVIKKT